MDYSCSTTQKAQNSLQLMRKLLSKAKILTLAGHVSNDACTRLPAAESEQTTGTSRNSSYIDYINGNQEN
jgi:hypothetical protein